MLTKRSLKSPHTGSMLGSTDDVSICGEGADQGFSYVLGPNMWIRIGQISSTFDSHLQPMYTLRFGGNYPGADNFVSCVGFPHETQQFTYANNQTSDMPIYFIIDSYRYSRDAGEFVLSWVVGNSLTPDGMRILTNFDKLLLSNGLGVGTFDFLMWY